MRSFPLSFSKKSLILCGLAWLLNSGAPAQTAASFPLTATTSPNVSFYTSKTRLWLGQSQVLCFKASGIAGDHTFSIKVDPEYLQVLLPPAVLPGETIGYVRLQAQKEGKTRITLDGASIDVEIVREAEANSLKQTRPEIVSPSPGSTVWGSFVVGVEQLNLSTTSAPLPPVLRLPDGQEIVGEKIPGAFPGPHLRYVFKLDAQSFPPGPISLVAVAKNPSSGEVSGEPVDIVVARPDPTTVIAGDCKDQITTPPPAPDKPPAHPPGPYRPPPLVPDAQSGTGSVVRSQLFMAITVPKDGLYALMMQVRGDVGGDALPTVTFQVDKLRISASATRLATTDWQRLPVGEPFSLTAGPHIFAIRFSNGFDSGGQDRRSLYLARYELAPLSSSAPSALAVSSASPEMMQASADTMTMQAMHPGMAQPSASGGSFHVFFKDAIQGKIIADEVQVAVRTEWSRQDNPLAPKVELLVNGHVAGSITHADPLFYIPVSAFQPGENKIQAAGQLADKQRAESPVESIFLPAKVDVGSEPYRPDYVFYPNDPSWDASMQQRLNPKDADSPATFYKNGDSTLALPLGLHGLYKVSVETRGTNFQGLPSATLVLSAQGQESSLGDLAAAGNWTTLSTAPAPFPPGPKSLILRFANDHFIQGKGIRTLFIRTINFEPVASDPAVTLPIAGILYPPTGTKVGFADAVVAKVFARNGVTRSDLLIDGTPQHLDFKPKNGFGPILFPLLTRALPPGPHRLQVEVDDGAGGIGRSSEVTVNVTGQLQVADGPYHRALFLLNRFGYGPEPDQLASLLVQGPHDWLAAQLSETNESPREKNEAEMVRVQNPALTAVTARLMQQLITDPNPVRMRFLVWAQNHFSTWIKKDGDREKARENERFVDLGIAPFPTLLLASATSPAMLLYLDQRYSVTKHLNENYAREIMELHTLGVKGGYTQKDVTTLADLLTGWTVTDEASVDGAAGLENTFRYDPFLNDGTACELLGMQFPEAPPEKRFDRVLTALEMLAAHPSCAQFISRKLAEQYVSDPAPPELVDHLARVYLETGGDMQAMLLAMLDLPAFWAADAKVASPIDYGVRMARMSGITDPGGLNDMVNRSGMGLFDRFSPDGYPEADAYNSNSNGMLQRWHFAQGVQYKFMNADLIPAAWRPQSPTWDAATTQRLIDSEAVHITGDVLSEGSNEAALNLLASGPSDNYARFRLLTLFLCQCPETSLR